MSIEVKTSQATQDSTRKIEIEVKDLAPPMTPKTMVSSTWAGMDDDDGGSD